MSPASHTTTQVQTLQSNIVYPMGCWTTWNLGAARKAGVCAGSWGVGGGGVICRDVRGEIVGAVCVVV